MHTSRAFHVATVVACLMFVAAVTGLPAQTIGEKMNAGLLRVFGASATISVGTASLTDAQIATVRAASGLACARTITYYTVSVSGRRVGFGLIDEVKGKVKMITYAVMVDNSLNIKDLEVLAYREPYGGEIQFEAFRKQFRGKGTRDAYKVGADIRNISGATISSNAVAAGTRKVMAIFNELKTAGALR